MCIALKNETMALNLKEKGDFIPKLSEFINLDDGEGVIFGNIAGNINYVGVVCGGYREQCDKITLQVLVKLPQVHSLLHIDQYNITEELVVVSKSNILKNIVLLYA